MSTYSNLVEMRSLIPKVIDKITMDNWFRNSESLEALLDQLRQRFPYASCTVDQETYLHIANEAEAMVIELVMSLSYGDLVQLLSENPWMLTTEAEMTLMEIFEEKLGKATVASMIAVVLCEHFFSDLMKTVTCQL